VSEKGTAVVFVGAVVGALISIVSSLPYLGVCVEGLLVLVAGGAVIRYYTRGRSVTVGGGMGAGLGAATAVVAALVNGAIGAVLTMTGVQPGWDEAAQQGIQRMREMGSPEQQIESMRQLFESSWFIVGVMGCGLIFYVVLGTIGGVIGASMYGQEEEADG